MADSQTLEEIAKSSSFTGDHPIIRIKSMFVLFILFIIISTDIFTKHVLRHVPGTASVDGTITLKGVLVQAMMLVLVFVVADLLVAGGLI